MGVFYCFQLVQKLMKIINTHNTIKIVYLNPLKMDVQSIYRALESYFCRNIHLKLCGNGFIGPENLQSTILSP